MRRRRTRRRRRTGRGIPKISRGKIYFGRGQSGGSVGAIAVNLLKGLLKDIF